MQTGVHTWRTSAPRHVTQALPFYITQCTHLHAYTQLLSHLTARQSKALKPELQRKWLVFKQACQDEPVTTFVQPIRQSFMFCAYNRRLISVG